MTASVEESPELREAWLYLFNGDLKRATASFRSQLTANDGASAAAGLLLCAAVMGAVGAVIALLSDRWERRRDAGLVLWRAAWVCALNGSDTGLDRLKAVLTGLPPEARENAAIHYADGHLAMLKGDEGAAISHFLAAKRAFNADPEWFLAPQDQTLTNVFVQTRHLLEGDAVDALSGAIGDPPALGEGPENPPCILVAADGAYLRRFGTGFVQSLDETNPGADLLVLAVDAAPEDTAKLALAGPSLDVDLRYQRSAFPEVNRPAVYASWRFLAMERLLAAEQRPVLVLDIDLIVRAPLAPLFNAMESADFGCWFRPDGGPGGIVRGGATGFAPTRDAWWMAALTSRYIQARFDEEQENLWFVDQAALWRAAYEAKKNRPDFRLTNFSQAGVFADFFDLVRDDAVKQR